MDDLAKGKVEELSGHNLRATYEIVTDMERARAAFETLVHDMADICLLITTEGQCVWGNRAAAELIGSDQELIPRYTIGQILPADAAATFIANLTRAMDGGEGAAFQLTIGKDAFRRELSWYLRPFRGTTGHQSGSLFIAVGRDVTTLLAERTMKVRLESQLATAQVVQDSIFPPSSLESPRLRFASFYSPAEQCSGDWWGHFIIGPDLELICIADVTGHGAAAALLTAVAHGFCATLAQLAGRLGEDAVRSPAFILAQLDQVLGSAMQNSLVMTFFAAVIDGKTGVMRYANAAHNFPILIPLDPHDPRLAKSPVAKAGQLNLTLNVTGNPLGEGNSTPYEERELELRSGDRLILYTDGLLENRGPDGSPWGRRRLHQALGDQTGLTLPNAVNHIRDAALSHYQTTRWADDVTLVVMEVI